LPPAGVAGRTEGKFAKKAEFCRVKAPGKTYCAFGFPAAPKRPNRFHKGVKTKRRFPLLWLTG